MDPETYDYRSLADRIEVVLGIRPSLATLRAAQVDQHRFPQRRNGRCRITAGMPAPLPKSSITAVAQFARDDVEQWLRTHPWRSLDDARKQLHQQLTEEHAQLEPAITQARQAGLTWSAIAHVFTEATGISRTAAGFHKAFRHIDDA